MNSAHGAGASRRSRRLAVISSIALLAVVAVVGIIRSGDARDERAAWSLQQRFRQSDAQHAQRLLTSVRGANAVLCAVVDRAFSTGSWGTSMLPVLDAISDDDAETARWIGRDHLDPSVLDIARRALSDGDACVRRMGARLVAHVAVKRLDQELGTELGAASPVTRRTAVLALGFADEKSAAEKLRGMLRDADEDVRLAAAWALGSIEDEASQGVMVQLLKSDPNPRMREIAAWALGRMLE